MTPTIMVPTRATSSEARSRRTLYTALSDDTRLLTSLHSSRKASDRCECTDINGMITHLSNKYEASGIDYMMARPPTDLRPESEVLRAALSELQDSRSLSGESRSDVDDLSRLHESCKAILAPKADADAPIEIAHQYDVDAGGLDMAYQSAACMRQIAKVRVRDRFRCVITGKGNTCEVICAYDLLDLPRLGTNEESVGWTDLKVHMPRLYREISKLSMQDEHFGDVRTMITLSRGLIQEHRRATIGLRPIQLTDNETGHYGLQVVHLRSLLSKAQTESSVSAGAAQSDQQMDPLTITGGYGRQENMLQDGQIALMKTDHPQELPLPPYDMWQAIYDMQCLRAGVVDKAEADVPIVYLGDYHHPSQGSEEEVLCTSASS